MTGDKVTGVYYTTRSDGVKLFRFAVPNTKHINDKGEEVWDKPRFKIRQGQTSVLYDEAIDVENAPYTYTETDIPAESEAAPQPETDLTVTNTLKMLNELGVETDDKNETSAREGIKEWINPKESQKPYNKNDKCYYKEQFWVSTIDNNISEPGGFANTWINI